MYCNKTHAFDLVDGRILFDLITLGFYASSSKYEQDIDILTTKPKNYHSLQNKPMFD